MKSRSAVTSFSGLLPLDCTADSGVCYFAGREPANFAALSTHHVRWSFDSIPAGSTSAHPLMTRPFMSAGLVCGAARRVVVVFLVEPYDQLAVPGSNTHVAVDHEADGAEHPALRVPLSPGEDRAYPVDQHSAARHVLSLPSPDISPSRLSNKQMSFSSNRLIPYFENPAGYKLRWPRPRTVGSGHGQSRRRRPWGTFSRVSAHGRYTIRRGYASVFSFARGFPSRCCLLARGAPSRCCLLARGAPSRSPAEGPEHPHAGKILRDHRGPW